MKTTWYHKNSYEDDLGWINIENKLPEANKKVKICNIRFMDWNLEFIEWESEGWYKHDALWSIKAEKLTKLCVGPPHPLKEKKLTNRDVFLLLKNNPVTHWKEI